MSGPARSIPTHRKQVRLTPETIEAVDLFASLQGMNFSAALEALTRLGLKDAPPDAYAAPLEAAVRSTVQAEMARVTALLASSAIDANAAYLVGLASAKRSMDATTYQSLKQAARLTARKTVRQRISRQGMADVAAILVAQHAESDD